MTFQPVPEDPTAGQVQSMLTIGDEWLVTVPGGFETAAVEAMRSDGSSYQRLIAVTWPVRHNHRQDDHTIRLMVTPADARVLADSLLHTARWLEALDTRNTEGGHR